MGEAASAHPSLLTHSDSTRDAACCPKAERATGRFHLYTGSVQERLRFIVQMQGLGFSLREIRELI
jgi:hypothetical protein